MFKKSSLLFSLLLPISLFSWEIVDYKPEHKEDIVDISFHDPEFFFPGYKQLLQSSIFNKEMFLQAVKDALADANKKTLVLLEGNVVAGFVTFYKTREQCVEDLKSNPACALLSVEYLKKYVPGLKDTKEECKPFAKIESIAVSKNFRRRGFGKILLKTVLDYIHTEWPELGYVVLDVANHNQPAQALYAQFGFIQLKQHMMQKQMEMFEYRKNLK